MTQGVVICRPDHCKQIELNYEASTILIALEV